MPHPRVLVITSCTGEKRFKPKNQLILQDFKDPFRLHVCETRLAEFICPARQMYTGMQHLQVMEGVQILRQSLGQEAVKVFILSAGYGLIPEDQDIAPYEVTFNSMKSREVDVWAQFLQVHKALEKAIQGYELVFVLLGENYLRAINLPIETRPEQTLIFLASARGAKSIQGMSAKTFVLPLSNVDAKRYSYGLVGLKGFLLKRFAEATSKELNLVQSVYETPEIFKQVIERSITQLELSLGFPELLSQEKATERQSTDQAKKSTDAEFLAIPNVPPAPNLHLGMQYFIPEWDDRVDPGYNFLIDKLTPNRDPYADEIYAHEIYDFPNYDGILVSKVVVDGSKRKRSQIEAVGIHKFIRFSGRVMGDCGAFGYIKEEVPPYSTDEILNYYQALGFNFGVSIDHLIVGPFAEPGIREKRYELTLANAKEFLKRHQDEGYTFTPIAAAQGWDPQSYAVAVREMIRAGYDYIALGGLAYAQSKEIIKILEAIYPHLTSKTRLHLFGVGRINAIPAFRHLGVTSFDSASPLRSAWLDPTTNYHVASGKKYTSIRVPQADGSGARIKNCIESGVADRKTLKGFEQATLSALRKFDIGELSLEETLEELLNYSELLEKPRDSKLDPINQIKQQNKRRTRYRELLEDRPWQSCNCPICQKIKVEVVIFRGNDRNRRRGFHNTYVFYKRFKALLQELGLGR
ncbi:tRNA-guanine transglycosylase DpdA [Leptolyngbya sp. FACHB-261]|uniref:tRNA-guanine transglycosylase DpdA n=1 Tax=Leptolyngbya sp. FACHB-261 TaxID=2692806 RepID=UPI0016823868|nr:tRNA-guanine transglycosylase DpdA [Leptolyngbya sp. FACHB-261]MBD2101025.1 queuine/archaeosine tRNA-ribosyltransferase [Leptolyngbya sp. FACHB-261]